VRTLSGAEGSVTVVAAVSPPGGDLTEPVTAHTQRFVRCLWTLDRDLAYGRHYPAVSWRSSFSRDADGLASWYVEQGDPGWQGRRTRTAALLAQADHLRSVAELVGEAALPGHERVVLLAARLVRDGVLRQSALDANDAACGTAKQAALFDATLAVHDAAQRLVDAGRPAALLEEVDLSRLVQAASQVGRNDAAGVARRRDEVLALLTREQD
jgi:V/A-type H+-transporting ATPase subunit A